MFDLDQITKRPVEEVVGKLTSSSQTASTDAAHQLMADARAHGLSVKDYLILAVDPTAEMKAANLNGFEAALSHLNLPFRNDFEEGVLLQAASDTFQQFPGTRAMFPAVIDEMLRWQNRQDQLVSAAALVANSRTIAGTEMVSTVVLDDSAERGTYIVPELANIPVRSIRTSESSVKMYKHGSGYRTSYEFNRRARLDILTPFANRVARDLEISKAGAALNVIINGDGVNNAADVVNQSSVDSGASANTLSWKALQGWLVDKAKNDNVLIDTVAGNWDTYLEWLKLFSIPTANAGPVNAELLAKTGIVLGGLPMLRFNINFVLVPTAPARRLIGLVKGETLEELVEAGAQIAESDQAIRNQSILYVRTETTGYKLAFGDTRTILDYSA